MRPWQRVATFWRFSWEMKVQFAQALLLPCAIRVGFRIVGIARTQGLLRSWSGSRRTAAKSASECIDGSRRAQSLVRRVSGVGGTCLVRSLTLWAMLRKRGVECDIRVGMRKNEGRIEGHAWVEYQGRPINEDASVVASYSALPEPATFDLWLLRSLS